MGGGEKGSEGMVSIGRGGREEIEILGVMIYNRFDFSGRCQEVAVRGAHRIFFSS